LLRSLLRAFHAKGRTIFITTHDMDEANQLCNRIAIISHGKIAAIDAPEKIKLATKELHSVEVSFNRPVDAASIAAIQGVNTVKESGDKLKLYTTDPGGLVVRLVSFAESNNLNIVTINTLAPSLEDAFVALVADGEK
jgi:ABC-2 type transport system ATP-binding protein